MDMTVEKEHEDLRPCRVCRAISRSLGVCGSSNVCSKVSVVGRRFRAWRSRAARAAGRRRADHALDALSTALDHLVKVVEDGGLDGYDQAGLLGFARSFEQVRRRSGLVDHRLVRDLETRRVAEARPSPARERCWPGCSGCPAARRAGGVRAAEQLGQRVTMTGDPLPPPRPALAAVVRAGDAGPEQVDICLRALGSVDHRGFDPADLDTADALLAGSAVAFAPAELREVAARVVDRIDPDATLPPEQLNTDRRHLALRKTRDGMWTVEGRLTGPVGAKLRAVLSRSPDPARRPSPSTTGGRWSSPTRATTASGCTTRSRRSATGCSAPGPCPTPAASRAPSSSPSPRPTSPPRPAGAPPATAPSSPRRPSAGWRARPRSCPRSSTAAAWSSGWGCTPRLATPGQTVALIARDGGCSFPGCDRPPEWCERHHIRAWSDGGPTDLDNLTLLCAYHHHTFAGRGWTCRIIDGLPAWTPPRWVTPHQRPLTNTRITARRHPERLRCERRQMCRERGSGAGRTVPGRVGSRARRPASPQ